MVDLELDALRREFLAEARAKVQEIESHLESRSFERVTYLAHQLKGSGGSYGFQKISTNAAELEKTIESMGDGADTKIREHVTNLAKEIEQREKELAT